MADRVHERRQAGRRALGALSVALLVHVGLAVWIAREPGPMPSRDRLTFELREVAPKHPVEPVPAPVPPQTAERKPRTLLRKPTETPDSRILVRNPDAGSDEAPPSGRGGVEAGGVIADGDAPGPQDGDGAGVDLFPRQLLEGLTGAGGRGPLAQPTADESNENDVGEATRVTSRIQRDIEAHEGRERVSAGRVDPYFAQLGESFRKVWAPKPSDIGGKDGDGLLAGVSNLIDGWRAAGRQWARTGSPYAEGEGPEAELVRRAVERAAGGTSSFDGADFRDRWNAGEFAFPGGVVLVKLTQRADGSPVKVEVVLPSGMASLDETAIVAVREAAKDRAAPEHGLGLGGPVIKSLWRMEAKYVAQTCALASDPTGGLAGSLLNQGSGIVPGLACGGRMDLATGEVDAQRPLTTKIVTKITLLAVYGGERTRGP